MVKTPLKDQFAVSAAAGYAVLASATEVEEGRAPAYHPNDNYASQVLLNTFSSCIALSAPGNDDH